MASDYLFASVASGVERLMSSPENSHLNQSITAQISAAIYYKTSVLSQLDDNMAFKKQFQTSIYNQIKKDYGEYMDAKARSAPKSFHHIYEWKKVGVPNARLFDLSFVPANGLSFKIKAEMKQSKSFVPTQKGRHRHVFANKAFVMEAGMPVKIAPRHSERLVFESDGETVYLPKGQSVTVKRPGGSAVKNQFYLATSRFFSGQLINSSIKKSGFQKLFNRSIKMALNVPADIKTVKYKFSPNVIRSQADLALNLAFGGSL